MTVVSELRETSPRGPHSSSNALSAPEACNAASGRGNSHSVTAGAAAADGNVLASHQVPT